MSRYLLTPTLYNAWRYYLSASPDKEPQKRAEFLATLRRKPFEPTEAILKGMAFEDAVRAQSEGRAESQNETVRELGKLLGGGLWQQKLSAQVNLAGREVLLCGVADVIKGDTIFDLKRTAAYAEGKYEGGLQHWIYLQCSGLPKFRYLAAYGSGKEPNGWAAEDYALSEGTLALIKERASAMLRWLEGAGWLKIYEENWKCKY